MKRCLILLAFSFVMFSSCRTELTPFNIDKESSKKKIERVKQNNPNSIDPGYFFDVTLRQNNAFTVTKDAFMSSCDGYYTKGDSSIRVLDDYIVLRSDSIASGKYKGSSFVCEYEYVLKAGGSHMMYLCPKNIKSLRINGNDIPKGLYSDFYTYVPLYGFGENRIEVSSVMDGVIALPSGTYWALR